MAARLCHAGYGPYMGGNTPSSGNVGVYLAMQMCSKVAVYGFGVNEVGGEKVTYHYYTGFAARKVRSPSSTAGGRTHLYAWPFPREAGCVVSTRSAVGEAAPLAD
jgi:hypothetical protein